MSGVFDQLVHPSFYLAKILVEGSIRRCVTSTSLAIVLRAVSREVFRRVPNQVRKQRQEDSRERKNVSGILLFNYR